MSKKIILIDFDGPINDVQKRYFQVHQLACSHIGKNPKLGQKEFWEKKRNRLSLSSLLLNFNYDELEYYRKFWLELIEDEVQLSQDSIWNYAPEVLSCLQKNFELWLVSIRSNTAGARLQLHSYGISRFFEKVIFIEHTSNSGGIDKAKAVQTNLNEQSEIHSFVGDTEIDVQAASLLSVQSYSVLSGIRSEKVLNQSGNTIIIDNLLEFKNVTK
jgi:phosphoglycolate phosphatase